MDDAGALCLDLTRSVRRAAIACPTGIDRVERAYLRAFLDRTDLPVFAIIAIGRRLALLDRDGMVALGACLDGTAPWAVPGMLGRLTRRSLLQVIAAEATVTGLAKALLAPDRIRAALPSGTRFFNVGHENLSTPVLEAMRQVPGSHVSVLIHDTIPLDHPEFHKPGMAATFARRLGVAADLAHGFIAPSNAVARDIARHLAGRVHVPPVRVAPLGVTVARPGPLTVTTGTDRPYFVTVGTIEPRKNHAVLLQVWSEMAAERPAADSPCLHIVGRRGWRNAEIFAQLDNLPIMGRTVFEHAGMPDEALAALVAGSCGLLHPSLAEGFGLPPHEALCLGVRPVCAPLEVYRETLDRAAVYAATDAGYHWRDAIAELAGRDRVGPTGRGDAIAGYAPPSWDAHFKAALTIPC